MKTIIPTLAMVMLAACTNAPEATGRVGSQEKSVTNPVLVEQLSKDPEFGNVLAEGLPLARAHAGRIRGLSPAERKDEFELLSSLPRVKDEFGSYEAFLSAYEFDPALLQRHREQVELVVARYGLAGMTQLQLRELFMEAALISPALLDSGDTVGTKSHGDPVEDCEEECRVTHGIMVVGAWAAYAAAVVSCGPTSLLCIAGLGSALGLTLLAAEEWRDECIAGCAGAEDFYCEDDGWCELYEYCDTGTLTFGTNECKHEKEEGSICTRHGQCLSECCKVYLGLSLHPTCRPRDKCD